MKYLQKKQKNNMPELSLKIVTPEKLILEQRISQITLPMATGEVTLLPEHMPYIGTLVPGEARIWEIGKEEESVFALSGGFVELHNNELTILADTAERAEDIDIERAEEARKRALELHKQNIAMDSEEYARTAAILEKEMMRVRIGRKHGSRRERRFSSDT